MPYPWDSTTNASFDACCARNLSDKSRILGHSYCDFYEEHLNPITRPRILEIGTGCRATMQPIAGRAYWPGAGARAFRDFFDAEVVTVDIDEKTAEDADDRGITALCLDAYQERSAEQLSELGSFDMVIDDGSHRLRHQMAFVKLYLPLVRPGSLIVVEDVMPINAEKLVAEFGGEVREWSLKDDDRLWFKIL